VSRAGHGTRKLPKAPHSASSDCQASQSRGTCSLSVQSLRLLTSPCAASLLPACPSACWSCRKLLMLRPQCGSPCSWAGWRRGRRSGSCSGWPPPAHMQNAVGTDNGRGLVGNMTWCRRPMGGGMQDSMQCGMGRRCNPCFVRLIYENIIISTATNQDAHLALGTRHQGLDDRPALVVQQVHLCGDHTSHRQGTLPA